MRVFFLPFLGFPKHFSVRGKLQKRRVPHCSTSSSGLGSGHSLINYYTILQTYSHTQFPLLTGTGPILRLGINIWQHEWILREWASDCWRRMGKQEAPQLLTQRKHLVTWLIIIAACLLLLQVQPGVGTTSSSTTLGDPYEILGIARTASAKEIRKAYKNLAVVWHPDKNKDPEAEEQFVKINRAYEVAW